MNSRDRRILIGLFAVLVLLIMLGKAVLSYGLPWVRSISISVNLPERVAHQVPFVCQAPSGNWNDPVQANGCEEACILMISANRANESSIDTTFVPSQMGKMARYEELMFGSFVDTGLDDTVRLFKWYEMEKDDLYSQTFLPYMFRVNPDQVSIERMKSNLAAGYVLLVPIDGQKLNHPYYRPPGPRLHMVLVIGYDDSRGVFIINDPGTKRGQGMEIFTYDTILGAMGDYRTGDHITTTDEDRPKAYVMIRVKPYRVSA